MKKKFLSYIPIFLLALVSGCEKEAKTSSADKSPVCFYLASSATTRATDKAFEKGDAIGVYATVREDNGTVAPLVPTGNFADNKKYIFDGDKFIPDGAPNSIFITSHPIDYYAYYPYNSTISNPLEFRFNVAANQDVLTKSDLMFAKNTDGTGKNNVPLKFIHKLAKVTVSYSNEHLDGAAEKAVINKAYTGSIINLSTGEIRTLTNEEKRDIIMFKSKTADTYFSAIFPAQTFSAVNPFITFNNSKEFKLSADRLFESGHASELPFMGKILEHQFSILPLEKNVGSKGELFSLSITSKKYYSVNGKIIPGTEAPADYICTSTGGDWLSYDKATRQVTVSENKDTQKGRTAIMTFKQVDSNKSASCTVTQSAGEITYGAWSVTISASPATIAASGGSSTLTYSAVRNVLTNGTVTGTESATPTISGSAPGFTLSGKTVTASNNTGTSARSVTYTATHAGKSASCTVTQSAGSKQFGAWGAWSVTVSANPTTIARTGGSSTITATATRSRVWTWNGVSASGGTESESGTPTLSASGAGFTLSGTTLSAGNNTSTSSRSCTVTASHGGKSASCTVTQPAGEVTYGAWSVTISASPTTIAASGGSSTLTYSAVRNVLTNGTVTGTESATPTISGSAPGFTLSGKTVTASNNTGTSARSVTYTATHAGKSASCTVTQSAGSKQFGAWGAWSVTVSANPTTIARTGGSSTITATATRSRVWTWNGVSASGGTESESGTPTLSASGAGFTLSGTTLSAGNNTSTSSRSCTVTASHGGKSASCTVTQSAGEITYGAWSVTISASPTTIAASGGSSTLTCSAVRNVLTNGTVTGTESATPTISGSAAGFTLSGKTVTASNNTGTSARSVTYTASHGGKSASCTVTQSAGSMTTDYSAWVTSGLAVTASPNPVAASGGNATLSCKANQTRSKYVKWNGVTTSTTTESQSVAVTAGWSKVSGSGSLSGATVSFGNNTSTSSLSGIYRASYGGKTGDVTVTQSAGSMTTDYSAWVTSGLAVTASPNPVAASGGNATLSCKANQTRSKYVKWNGVTTSTTTESQSVAVTAGWSKVSGSGSLSGATVSFGNNTSTSSLSGIYRASYGGKTGDVTVTQSAGSMTTDYSAWVTSGLAVTASPNPVAASGGNATLSCKANQTRSKYVKWNGVTTSTTTESQSVAVTAGWSKVSGSGSLSGATVSFGNNTSTSSLSGIYRASYGGKTGDVTVTQSAGSMTTDYSAWVTSGLAVTASPNPVAASGGNATLSCKANQTRSKYVKWNGVTTSTTTESQSVAVTAGWSKVSGSGSLSGATVSFGNNTSTSSLSGIYRASYGGKTGDVTVTQSAGSMTTDYSAWVTSGLAVTASPNPVAASGGNATLSCKANQTRSKYVKWNGVTTSTTTESQSVAVTAGWSKVSGSGLLSGATVSFGNNTSTSSLSGIYRASYGGKTGDVTVSQYGGSVSYSYTFTFSDGTTATSWSGVDAGGSSKTFSINSTRTVSWNGIPTGTENITYSGSSNVSWASASGSTVTVGDNPGTTVRSGKITFTQAESNKTITVTVLQLKKNSVIIG